MNSTSLLSKAISLSDHSGPDLSSDPISVLKEIPQGLNAPFEVFRLICREMKFNHAALLMLDPEKNSYFPVVYRNFDRTTALRLQIHESAIDGLIKKESRIQRYFSYADSRVIHDYGLFNLSSSKHGLYLLYTVTSGNSEAVIQDSFLDKNKELISSKILTFDKGVKAEPKREISPLFLIKANQFIRKNQSRNKTFHLFFIDAKETIDRIVSLEGLKAVNSYQIESRCSDIFENNIEDFGKMTRINFGEFLLIVQLQESVSPELLKEHFSHSLSIDFDFTRKWKDLEIRSSKYFETVSTIGKAATLLLEEN